MDSKISTETQTAAAVLSAEARMIARIALGGERDALLTISRALRDPDRVAQLVDGLIQPAIKTTTNNAAA